MKSLNSVSRRQISSLIQTSDRIESFVVLVFQIELGAVVSVCVIPDYVRFWLQHTTTLTKIQDKTTSTRPEPVARVTLNLAQQLISLFQSTRLTFCLLGVSRETLLNFYLLT